MVTNSKLQELSFCGDMVDLVCQIDSKLSSLAKNKLDSLKYGTKVCINSDDFDYLSTYKNILSKKLVNNICYKDYFIDDIISRIKQLLNKN